MEDLLLSDMGYGILAASPRRRDLTVASRLGLRIFKKFGKQSLRDCDSAYLEKNGKVTSQQSLHDCGSAYLNSRFATVTSQQSFRDCDSTYLTKLLTVAKLRIFNKMTAYNWRLKRTK